MARVDIAERKYGRGHASSPEIDEREPGRWRTSRSGGPPRRRGPGGDRPSGPRPPKWTRITIISGAIVALISFGALAIVYGVSEYVINKVKREDMLPPEIAAPVEDDQPMNFLVLGSDSRDGQTVQDVEETGYRSDVIMLVHVKADLSGAYVISIPRDSYVDIPPSGDWRGGKDKINHAMMYGGARLTAQTVHDLTQIPLNGVVLINFDGIQNMVRAVGGVEACTPVAFESSFSHKWYDVGCHDLTPQDAEFWARERYNLPGGDLGRIKNQQQLIKGLMKKVVSGGLLTDPAKLNDLINAATESLTVDQNLDLRELAFKLKDINPNNVQFATAPHADIREMDTVNGPASVVLLNMVGTNEMFAAVRENRFEQWLAANPQSEIASY